VAVQRFRVAIIGTGFGRLVQAVGFRRHGGFELTAIAGRDHAKTERVARELEIPRALADWRSLFEGDPPDLVSIVTPVDLHHPMMLRALEAGCHVLCEKPSALHRFQTIDMRDAARAARRVAGMNHEFRFFPARRHALALVAAGAIGRPRRGEILGRYPIWPTPGARGMTWLSDRARGGGILGALGSHHTDCLRLFFGEPITVLASVRTDQPRRGPTADDPRAALATADDAVTLHYAFEGGATALIDMNATTPYRWERFEIHGEEAALRWDETGYALWRIAPGRDPEALEIPAKLALQRRKGDPALVAPFGALLERLHRAMCGEAEMSPNFDDAVAVQCALDAARSSGAAGAVVAIDRPPVARAARDP
jgi:predicted dehydrogenase